MLSDVLYITELDKHNFQLKSEFARITVQTRHFNLCSEGSFWCCSRMKTTISAINTIQVSFQIYFVFYSEM